MPGMSGVEIARQVSSDPRFENLRMIILTSMGHTPVRRELDEAGIGLCLVKPDRLSQLRDALVTLLGGPPAHTARPANSQPPSSAIADGAGLKLRILVAEDNLVNQHVARKMLEKLGYEPDIVADGAKAVEAALSHPYDVIFMDCQMPELDGFEATRRIREWEKRQRSRREAVTPSHIVALTANAMAGDRENCLAAGMTDYLSKPLHASALAAALARSPAAQSQMNERETANA
jgi:CheY-like chemotaxis protein